jgi:hypothetical protein
MWTERIDRDVSSRPAGAGLTIQPPGFHQRISLLSGGYMLDNFEIVDGLARFRPRGRYSLVDAVDLISRAIADCRDRGVDRLLIDVMGLGEVPIPSLVDRFLMAEDWAQASQRRVVAVLVAPARYIHPRKFGVTVAAHFGLTIDVFPSEPEAVTWLLDQASGPLGDGQ